MANEMVFMDRWCACLLTSNCKMDTQCDGEKAAYGRCKFDSAFRVVGCKSQLTHYV